MDRCSRFFGSQVLVFHFPGMIHSVKGSVPNQVAERPLAGHLALGVVVPYGLAVGSAMRLQPLASQHRTVGSEHTKPLRPVLLVGKDMTDDVVPIPPSASRPLLQLSLIHI